MGKYLFEWWANDGSRIARSGQTSTSNDFKYSNLDNSLFCTATGNITYPCRSNLNVLDKFTYILGFKAGKGNQENGYFQTGIGATDLRTTYYTGGVNQVIFKIQVSGLVQAIVSLNAVNLIQGRNYFFVVRCDGVKLYASLNRGIITESFITGTYNLTITNALIAPGSDKLNLLILHRGWLDDVEIGEIYRQWLNPTSKSLSKYYYLDNLDTTKVSFIETFEDNPIGNPPENWLVKSGVWVVDELLVNNLVIPELKRGTRYLKCTSTGYILIPYDKLYGEFTFMMLKSNTTDLGSIGLVQNSKDIPNTSGYTFGMYQSTGRTAVIDWPSQNTILYSQNSLVSTQTWYKFRYRLLNSGSFWGYIRGGSYLTDTLIPCPDGNPRNIFTYNSCIYIAIFGRTGDCFTLIKHIPF